jgi:hypothetical protein
MRNGHVTRTYEIAGYSRRLRNFTPLRRDYAILRVLATTRKTCVVNPQLVICVSAGMAALFFALEDETRRAFRRERVFRDRLNPLDAYDDVDLLRRY